MLETSLDKREIFLEAVALWSTPFPLALPISFMADTKAVVAAVLSFLPAASMTCLDAVFTRLFHQRLYSASFKL